jgi:hypothetical protein
LHKTKTRDEYKPPDVKIDAKEKSEQNVAKVMILQTKAAELKPEVKAEAKADLLESRNVSSLKNEDSKAELVAELP